MIYTLPPQSLKSLLISLDSRQIYDAPNTAFFAVRGIHHDGHQYIENLYKSGIKEFIVEKVAWTGILSEKAKKWNDADFHVVENSIQTLQNLAALHRSKFDYDLVAITGSNGKTICKEWLATLLNGTYNLVKSPKSFNSQIGVPLSVWAMKPNHNLGIFEAGISQPGEMANLETILKPSHGILTHFGEAHGANFRNEDLKLQEKLKLFKTSKTLIYRSGKWDKLIHTYIKSINPGIELIEWSTEDPTKNIFVHFNRSAHETQIKLKKASQSEPFIDIKTELTDDASLENICHCLIMAHVLAMDNLALNQAIRRVKPISMRLEIKEGLRDIKIIDDSYNNDIDGLRLALPLLMKYETKKKILILSDFLETGLPEENLYNEINTMILNQKIDLIIGIGSQISRNKDKITGIEVYQSTEEFLKSGKLNSFYNAAILLKGARKYNFEKLVYALENKSHCTQLEINLDALQHNLSYYKNKIGLETKLMVMIKAFAYGAGAVEIGQILQQQGVDYLTVAYTDEGVELRKNGIYTPIMVMNPQIEEFTKLIEYSLEPEIYSFELLKALDEYCLLNEQNIKIHIKLDTGMKRLGFESHEIESLANCLAEMPQLWVVSMMSHLVASESIEHDLFTKNQIAEFKKMSTILAQKLSYKPLLHIANSAAIENYPEAKLDMVRLGISLYGITQNQKEIKKIENVLTLKTFISQIKHIDKNETVGYGRKGKVNKKSTIATLAIGYADGYPRSLGMGKGHFEINGELCHTIGAICMDMTMVDISHLKHVATGDTALAFGGKIQLSEIANNANTIPYEIMTNISSRVKRVYIKN
jgi:alanine racemase